MISSKLRLLAVAVLVLGAAATAYACGDDDKTSKTTKASLANAGGSCCASKASAAVASASGDHCAKGAKGAMAGGDHCVKGVVASSEHCVKGAMAGSACTYGENSVTMASASPVQNEADYAFFVSGAECQGTGAEVARTIKALPGVASVTVDYAKHMAYVCADGKAASKKSIQSSLKKAGYSNVKFVSQSRDNCGKSHGKVEA